MSQAQPFRQWRPYSSLAAERAQASRRGGPPPLPTPPPPVMRLPRDLLLDVLQRVDLPSRLAAVCVCTEWRDACADPSLWSNICVPQEKAFRLWDSEFAALVLRCQGRLKALDVSGSGITGRSLIRLIEARALAPAVTEIRLSHCCNLKLCDILAFIQALEPSASSSMIWNPSDSTLSTPLAAQVESATATLSLLGSLDTELENYLALRERPRTSFPRGTSGSGQAELKLKDVLPAAAPPSRIQRLYVDGCKQLGAWEVQKLQRAVGELDVAICSCSRIGVLQRCNRGSNPAQQAAAAVGQAASTLGGTPAHPGDPGQQHPGEWTHLGVNRRSATQAVATRQCPGLCAVCAEVFKGCGESVCGACWEPRAASEVQALRTRLRLWHARREAMSALRSRWTDFRYGVELRSLVGNA